MYIQHYRAKKKKRKKEKKTVGFFFFEKQKKKEKKTLSLLFSNQLKFLFQLQEVFSYLLLSDFQPKTEKGGAAVHLVGMDPSTPRISTKGMI